MTKGIIAFIALAILTILTLAVVPADATLGIFINPNGLVPMDYNTTLSTILCAL
ncbi:MAG: hypothetical protein R3Y23_04080 [Bacillota bacterium]